MDTLPVLEAEEAQPKVESMRELFDLIKSSFSGLLPFNMTRNFDYLHDALLQKRDCNLPPKLESPRPAFVIGSGPSLDEAMPLIERAKAKQHADIFCGPTQVWALVHSGITPEYLVYHDQNYRRCLEPGCVGDDQGRASLVYARPDGQFECMLNHHVQSPENEAELYKGIYLHRQAPDIEGCTMLAHPGIMAEALRWPAFVERGRLFLLETNPIINGVLSRDYAKQQHLSKTLSALYGNVVDIAKARKLTNEWFHGELEKVADAIMHGPNTYERQDIIIDLGGSVYGPGNPYNRYPLSSTAMIAGSTPMQAAFLAWKMGYDPVYLIGWDGCEWKGRRRHNAHYHDGSSTDMSVEGAKQAAVSAQLGPESGLGSSGFKVNQTRLGEKYTFLSYLSKQVGGQYLMPGLRCYEVVVDETPGNLELLPRIGMKQLSKGKTRALVTQNQMAGKIRGVLQERREMI